jgi:hypothetical protein
MSTESSRKDIYRQARAATNINKRQWARLMSLGSLDGNIMSSVGKKEKRMGEPHSRGVTMTEALAAGLLEYLHNNGMDVKAIEFDDDGKILNIPKR